MYRYSLLALLLVAPASAQVIDLQDVTLPPLGYLNNAAFVSRGAGFNNNYDTTFGSWGGFAASNIVDATTAGFGNQYASFAGGGDASTQYAVAFLDTFTPTTPTIALPAGQRPVAVRLTNTTYTGLSMRDGDGFAKKFGGPSGNDPDFYTVTITGKAGAATVGSINFDLADFRFANNAQDYILNSWTTVDLSPLSAATSLEFTLTSSDNGPFGMNTPAFFALDNLTVTAVPEPGSMVLIASVLGFATLRRRVMRLVACIE